MNFNGFGKMLLACGGFLALWLGIRYLLPVGIPFLLGGVIALAAEPMVGFCVKKAGIPRGVAAGVGVSVTLLLAMGLLWLLGGLAVKELGALAQRAPQLYQSAKGAVEQAQKTLERSALDLPMGIQPVARKLLEGGGNFINGLADQLPGALANALGWIPQGALGIGTGVVAGFMISARLPRLRQILKDRIPTGWREKAVPALLSLRESFLGWLKAQGKLTALTWGLMTAGFLLLGIENGLLWAVPVAVVDAVPVLGTGVALIPWGLICFLRGQTFRALGLWALWLAAVVIRRVLEPKLVGQHLGLDPLAALLFLYLGYRFWGFTGMILAPLLAGAVKTVASAGGQNQ